MLAVVIFVLVVVVVCLLNNDVLISACVDNFVNKVVVNCFVEGIAVCGFVAAIYFYYLNLVIFIIKITQLTEFNSNLHWHCQPDGQLVKH